MGEAGVVDEHVDPTEPLLRKRHRLGHGAGIGDVEVTRGGVGSQGRRHIGRSVGVEVGEHDVGAFGGEVAAELGAERPGPTGDHDDLLAEPAFMDHDVPSLARRRRSTAVMR